MDELTKLTRIILIGLGIYILVIAGFSLFWTIPYLLSSIADSPTIAISIGTFISTVFSVAYAGLIFYLLWHKADFLAERIVGTATPSQTKAWWLPFSFRLTAVFCGIYFMYHLVSSVVSTVSEYVMPLPEGVYYPRNLRWDRVANWVVSSALAIYLLFGAPHFVRWQVKKTLEQCKDKAELGKAADEDEKVSS